MMQKSIEQGKLTNIIVYGNARELVAQAEELGTILGSRRSPMELTTNQIRAIFGSVRRIEMYWGGETSHDRAEQDLILLKPKMLYRAKKESGSKRQGLEVLAQVLSDSIDLVVSGDKKEHQERFRNFVNFFEAILAYHAVAGGK